MCVLYSFLLYLSFHGNIFTSVFVLKEYVLLFITISIISIILFNDVQPFLNKAP